MHELSRQSANYKNLAAKGVSITILKPVSFWDSRWCVGVNAPEYIDRTTLKRLVQWFLEVEFEASEFNWYAPKSRGNSRAFCYFKSFAL